MASQRLTVWWVVLMTGLLATGLVAPTAGVLTGEAGTAQSIVGTNEAGDFSSEHQPRTQATNNTTRHKDPRNNSERGDLLALQGWLAGRMGSVLIDCSKGVELGAYDPCDNLDGDYPDWLSKYVDIAKATDSRTDDRASEAFEETRKAQKQLVNQTQRARRAIQTYRAARRAGNVTKARRAARRLDRVAGELNRTSADLITSYVIISNLTDVQTRSARLAIRNVTTNITRLAERIAGQTFINTTLTVRTQSGLAAFGSPLVVHGRLTTENGTPLADRRIVFRVLDRAGRRVTARTTANGTFTLRYRVITPNPGKATARVSYVPRPIAPYRRSSERIEFRIGRTVANVTVNVTPQWAGFGDEITVTGSVKAANVSNGSVPVVIRLGSDRIGTVETDPDGRFRLTTTVPATLPPGNRTVQAALSPEAAALTGPEANAMLRVLETSTRLTLTEVRGEDGEVRVIGRLTTRVGRAAPGRTVRLSINGTRVTTAETGVNGTFTTIFTVPNRLLPATNGTKTFLVQARFTGEGTNLKPARASERITLRIEVDANNDTNDIDNSTDPPAGVYGGVIGGTIAGTISTVLDGDLASLTTDLFSAVLDGDLASLTTDLFSAVLDGDLASVIGGVIGGVVGGVLRGSASEVIGSVIGSLVSDIIAGRTPIPGGDNLRIGAVVLITILIILVWYYREPVYDTLAGIALDLSRSTSNDESTRSKQSVDATATGDDHDSSTDTVEDRLRDRINAGDIRSAIEIGYGLARQRLTTRTGIRGAYTHWEFYRACRKAGLNTDREAALRELTTAYERAVFAPDPPSVDDGTTVIESFRRLIRKEETETGGSADD